MTRLAALCIVAAFLAPTGAAWASANQESVLMDDAQFVYGDAQQVDARMAEAKALGVDRIRVSVLWRLVAPNPNSEDKPQTGSPRDPRWYGQGKWDRYDRIAQLAAKHGLGVLFSVTGPAPLWATGKPEQGRDDVADTWNPSAAEFGDFVYAVATRYSGSWQDERQEPAVVPLLPPTTVKNPPLPRVDHWSIWNEPNHGGWLTPQWNGALTVPQSPRIYRGLLDSAWSALQTTGHGGDTILLGETAPRGLNPGLTRGLHPLRFIRELYCLNAKLKPFSGKAAQDRGCPPSFDAGAFVAAHPALFNASGWAHHPYSLETSPRTRDRNSDDATLTGIPRLTRTLDRASRRYGQARELPVWVTEYGYQTNPPDPTLGVPLSRQAAWLDDATYIAYRNRRIASFAQFLLVDDGPIRQYGPSDPRYWGTFQTGLVALDGKRKPAYNSFKRPISVSPSRVKRGRKVRVFGQLRPAADGQRLTAQIQFRPVKSRAWSTVATVTVGNARGFLDTLVTATRSGSYRIAWSGNGASRAVAVTVRRS